MGVMPTGWLASFDGYQASGRLMPRTTFGAGTTCPGPSPRGAPSIGPVSGCLYGGTPSMTPSMSITSRWASRSVLVSRMPKRRMWNLAGKFWPGTIWLTLPLFGR